ncbi:hypothetical protein [Marinobacter sp.]|uniref:hypothetical protein n=1 Tax=Marinobacter sp. TaxID=50741 RepID=UPI003B52F48D
MKSNKLLDREGNFRCAFYHGTSTLFLDSIRETGLGGRNKVKEFGWAIAFKDLFGLADQRMANSAVWQKVRGGLLPIVKQGLTSDGLQFNFSHGQVYISPVPKIAERYALEAGCEILDYVRRLSLILHHEGYTQDVQSILPTHLQETLGKTYRPVLLKINCLRFRDVETENGVDKLKLLRKYEAFFGGADPDPFMPSWKLVAPVPKSQLEFHYL